MAWGGASQFDLSDISMVFDQRAAAIFRGKTTGCISLPGLTAFDAALF